MSQKIDLVFDAFWLCDSCLWAGDLNVCLSISWVKLSWFRYAIEVSDTVTNFMMRCSNLGFRLEVVLFSSKLGFASVVFKWTCSKHATARRHCITQIGCRTRTETYIPLTFPVVPVQVDQGYLKSIATRLKDGSVNAVHRNRSSIVLLMAHG